MNSKSGILTSPLKQWLGKADPNFTYEFGDVYLSTMKLTIYNKYSTELTFDKAFNQSYLLDAFWRMGALGGIKIFNIEVKKLKLVPDLSTNFSKIYQKIICDQNFL